MTVAFGVEDVERFRVALAGRLGLHFEDAKVGLLGEVLHQRLDATRRSCESYLHHVEAAPADTELGALAQELTIPETYFFRNIDQFHAFAQRAVPERMHAQGMRGKLRVVSAGCASGEEAYTIAILLRQTLDPGCDASVLAVDINPAALDKAKRGRFSTWSLRETPPDVQRRWFKQDAHEFVLDDAIRAAVRFDQRNLAEDDPDLWGAATYDVVFCRNVIMYFTPESARALVARITRALVPGGYLFLGHAETLRGLSQDFHLCHTHGTFYYQRRDERLTPAPHRDTGAARRGDVGSSPLVTLVEEADTWVDAIRMATERVQHLTEPLGRVTRGAGSGAAPARPRWDLAQPLALLQEERFAEALDLVDALPLEAADAPDVLLLQAVLLAHGGLLGQAEEVCRRLLEIDELNAGAQYLLALCREGAGDDAGAVEHDRAAIYLDPGFAMPCLHLGLLARRAGDEETSLAELRRAVSLLEVEDPSRLLLFGGGFSRDALTALCRSEMLARGERP